MVTVLPYQLGCSFIFHWNFFWKTFFFAKKKFSSKFFWPKFVLANNFFFKIYFGKKNFANFFLAIFFSARIFFLVRKKLPNQQTLQFTILCAIDLECFVTMQFPLQLRRAMCRGWTLQWQCAATSMGSFTISGSSLR